MRVRVCDGSFPSGPLEHTNTTLVSLATTPILADARDSDEKKMKRGKKGGKKKISSIDGVRLHHIISILH